MGAKRYCEADYARMAELRETGMSIDRIAKEMRCSSGWVNWQCLRLGAESPNARPLPDGIIGPAVMRRSGHEVRRFMPEEDALLLTLAAAGLNPTAIGRKLGRRSHSVRGRLMTLARRDARKELVAA